MTKKMYLVILLYYDGGGDDYETRCTLNARV